MAQPVYLRLEIDGNQIEGESPIHSMDRAGTIECYAFHYGLEKPIDDLRAIPQHSPVKFHKRIDKTTPLLIKALGQGQPVRAEFRFFRPSPLGTGEEEQFYTVVLERAYISSVTQVSEHDARTGHYTPPAMEEVAIRFRSIEWIYEPDGVSHRELLR
jgi:type VI secretion system Hcp family effector